MSQVGTVADGGIVGGQHLGSWKAYRSLNDHFRCRGGAPRRGCSRESVHIGKSRSRTVGSVEDLVVRNGPHEDRHTIDHPPGTQLIARIGDVTLPGITPTALMTRPPSRTFMVRASAEGERAGLVQGAVAELVTCSSRSVAMRLTCDFDRRSMPKVLTSLSMRRVLTPAR